MTFETGGKGTLGAGILLLLGALLFMADCQKFGVLFQPLNLAVSFVLLVAAFILIFVIKVIRIDPVKQVVTLESGLRFCPKVRVHQWDEFEAVVARTQGSIESRVRTGLYLRDKESKSLKLLLKGYNQPAEMFQVARELSELMGIPGVKRVRNDETPLELNSGALKL